MGRLLDIAKTVPDSATGQSAIQVKERLSTLKTLLTPEGVREIRWPYATPEEEPRCVSCRRWREIPGEVWHATGERVGDCTLHSFQTLERENCFGHSDAETENAT